ncbi:hypothetical protein DW355_00745 [Hylemonella gracilis]|uniref:Ubiquinone biosynthesis protein UbiJ n=1 Tax=Hylemonella gracilis TaxID=80880 RepID=A0A4P6UHI8_9BURK|nr:hypothetical protein [Hylemonella gracilis]QBK03487.1 hypothetical protein DW355_00745 [Hylemonella gracilis]
MLADAAQKLLGVLPKPPFPLPLPSLDRLPQPPAWAVREVQRRVVLLLNHVLMQEPEAMTRLARQQGRAILFQWRDLGFMLRCTPAGLFDLADAEPTVDARVPDLTLTVTETSPLAVAQALLAGEQPSVRIEGHVALASELSWLTEHLRWDIEEDLARLIGDAPAHSLAQAARRAAQALRAWLPARSGVPAFSDGAGAQP